MRKSQSAKITYLKIKEHSFDNHTVVKSKGRHRGYVPPSQNREKMLNYSNRAFIIEQSLHVTLLRVLNTHGTYSTIPWAHI